MRQILHDGIGNINQTYTSEGCTLLKVAADSGFNQIVNLLLDHHADPNIGSYEGSTPLIGASGNGHCEVVAELIKHNADINKQNIYPGNTPLIIASLKGHNQVVKHLLENNADVNKENKCGDTALICSSKNGHLETVKTLLTKNPEVNKPNKYAGNTALIFSSMHGHDMVVTELLKNHANGDKENNYGDTPLIVAARSGHLEVVKKLISCHSDINKQNKSGDSPLNVASLEGQLEIVKELLKHNADVNLLNNVGNTPLHEIIASETHETQTKIDIAKHLLAKGANPEQKNKSNKSTIQLAKELHNQEIIMLLEDFVDKKIFKAKAEELQQLKARQIIKERKKKLKEVSSSNQKVNKIRQDITTEEAEIKTLEESINMSQRNISSKKEKIEKLKYHLKTISEREEFRLHEKLRKDIEYYESCSKTKDYNKIIGKSQRDCSVCYYEMRVNQKVYQCKEEHNVCEKCFNEIRKTSKKCRICAIDIAGDPIRNKYLEERLKREHKESINDYFYIVYSIIIMILAMILYDRFVHSYYY